MDRPIINILNSGNVVSITPTVAEGHEELRYRIMHSLNDTHVGMIDTNRINGMSYGTDHGYAPEIDDTMIVRSVVEEGTFRAPLVKYIQKYVHADQPTILKTIGRDNVDSAVVRMLSLLPRRSVPDRIGSRVYTVTNILSRIPHVPISRYLDYGTGDGTVADAIGKVIGAHTRGVDVFHMDRPIPTTVIREGDTLPSEWSNRFHLITAFVVLHHVKDQEHALRELYRVLAPGGILIMREHDYRDMIAPSVLMKQKVHVDDVQGTISNADTTVYPHAQYTIGRDPYRQFIDAVHVVSMAFTKEPSFWSLYRSRMEWHMMMQRAGFSHMCTNMGSVSSQMDRRIYPSRSWIDTNPQRLFESVYRKDPSPDMSLIIEYRIDRSISVHNVFPKKGGYTGTIPAISPGINYDDEVLAYMTPWYPAQQTSILISRLIYGNYLSSGEKYSIYDGTGGGGGNALAFMNNPDISTINVYEEVDKFYRYIVNNLSLYSDTTPVSTRDGVKISGKNTVYIHHGSFNIQDPSIRLRGNVLYLDVPWVSSGCGYKLYGYRYNGMSLEMIAHTAIKKGAYMVVLKLPPQYNLRIKHDVEEIGSMSLYIIHKKYIRGDDADANVAHEVIRYRLMDHIHRQYMHTFPDSTDRDYYIWLHDRIITSSVPQYTPDVSMPFDQLSSLIEREYPSLVAQLRDTFFLDEDAIAQLRTSLREEMSLRYRDRMSTLDTIVEKIHDRYMDIADTTDVGAYVFIGDRDVVGINPNDRLRTSLTSIDRDLGYTMQYPQCPASRAFICMTAPIDMLRRRYSGSTFNTDVAAMCMRYASLSRYSIKVPISLLHALHRSLQVDTQCFTSPLNAILDRYMGMFPDVDSVFGSVGTFSSYIFDTDASYEMSLPYVVPSVIERLNAILDRNISLSFIVIVPNRDIGIIKASRWRRYDTVVGRGIYIAILQSDMGTSRYRIPTNIGSIIQSSYR